MHQSNGISTMTGSSKLSKSKNKFVENYFHDDTQDGNLIDFTIQEEYETTWENNEWHDVNFKIDKVKISGENNSDIRENDYGHLSLHFVLNNVGNKEVSLKPNKAWVVLSDGRKLQANSFFDTWKNIFSKDKKTHGYIHFNFCKMSELKDIRGIYIEFSGYFLDKSDEKVVHIYEVPLYS